MKSILIIEDDPELLENCSDILELSGFNVIKAKDGHTGINCAIQTTPDLILCDIMMPNLDGYGVFAILANNALTAKIPFIFMSAKTEYADVRRAMEAGADDYITKPFNPDQLIKAIQIRLNKANTPAELPQNNPLHSSQQSKTGDAFEHLQHLIGQARLRKLKKRQMLFCEGDQPQGLYLLVEGHVKTLKHTRDGRQLITGLYKPKDCIGLDALLLDSPFNECAEAIEDSKAYLLPKATVIQALDQHPELSQHFIKVLSKNIHEKEEQLIELAYESVRKRLAQVLIRLTKHIHPQRLNISREELAGLAGMATETVSRVLTDFRDEGLIEKDNGNILILDPVRLANMKS